MNHQLTYRSQLKKCIALGKICGGIQGPIGKCCPGTVCYQKFPDYFICKKEVKPPAPGCIKPGGLCAGIAGPVGKCCPGYECKNEFPDYSICKPLKTEPPYGQDLWESDLEMREIDDLTVGSFWVNCMGEGVKVTSSQRCWFGSELWFQ